MHRKHKVEVDIHIHKMDKKNSIWFKFERGENMGAGATFDLTFFDNSKLINFDD